MARKHSRPRPVRSFVRLEVLEGREVPAPFNALAPNAASGLNNNGCVAVGDFDKDGDPDAVMANFGLGYGAFAASKITILYGNGANGYAKVSNLSTGGKNISYVDVGDVNGDGFLDIAAGNATTGGNQADGSSVSIFLNNGTGGFTLAANSPFTTAGFRNLSSVDLADVTGDGKLDVVATHFGFDNGSSVVGQGIAIYSGSGDGKFALFGQLDPTTSKNLGIEFIPTNTQAADLNGDGILDLAASVPGIDLSGGNDPGIPGFVYIFAGTGGGAFVDSPQTFGSGGGLPVSLTLADVDGKNGMDVLVGNAGNPNASPEFKGSSIGLLLNNGTGGFSEDAISTNERGTFAAVSADFNLDGKADIAAANYGSQGGSVDAFVSVYYGNGNGGFIPAVADGSPFDTGYGDGGAQFLAVGDFDMNTTPDLIVAHAPSISTFATSVVQLDNQSAAPVTTATALTAAPNPSFFGESVTFTATVTSGAGVPTGTVAFFDNGVQIGTDDLDAAGVATLSTSTLGASTHPITAKYLGAGGFSPSPLSSSVSQQVNQATTGTALMVSPSIATQGDMVTFTATVTSPTTMPTGTVKFFDGGTQVGTGTVNPTTGIAVFSTGGLSVGGHTITAQYVGTANVAGSTSSGQTVTVNAPASQTTSTAVLSSLNPSVFTNSVTFTATVTAASGNPTGTVAFFDNGVQIGTGILSGAGSSPTASFSTATLNSGPHSITAQYLGVTGFTGSTSSAFSQTVNMVTTSVGVMSNGSPVTFGQPVTFTATVTGNAGNPTGTVAFFDNGVQIGTGTLSGAGTVTTATFQTSNLGVGTRTITAQYTAANANYTGSTSGPFSQVIDAIGTTITVMSTANPSTAGQTVTLTATVTAGSGNPTGTVNFFDGGTQIGTGTLSGGGSQATVSINTAALGVGPHSITAQYAGTGEFKASTSSALPQQVDLNATGLTLTVGATATFGQPVLLTADITTPFGTPTGTVNFFDGPTFVGSGTLSPVPGGFRATASVNGLGVGSHTLSAQYAGSGTHAGSNDTAPLTVNPIGTTTTVTANPTAGEFGQTITFTARVSATGGTATGSVSFFDGNTLLGTVTLGGGNPPTASFTTDDLGTGPHTVTAKYAGAVEFAASDSTNLSLNISPADTLVTLTSSDPTSVFTRDVTFTAVVSSAGGTPGGMVAFFDGGTQLGTATLVAGPGGQTASFTVDDLSVGTRSITARYLGATDFDVSTSAAVSQAVDPVTTTITVSANPTAATAGQPVTLTALLSPTDPLPAGSVSFFDGNTLLGTANYTAAGGGFRATFTVDDLAVGSRAITAKYAGATGYTAAESPAVNITISEVVNATTIELTSSAGRTEFGDTVTLTATVSSTGGSPTGTVTFFDGTTVLGTAAVQDGTASFTTSAFDVGTRTLSASFAGTGTFTDSRSDELTQTIDPASTSVSLSADTAGASFGRALTFTAVVGSSAGTPGGVVTFLDGTTVLGTGTLRDGTASFTTSALGVGSRNVTARFEPSGSFAGSTSTSAVSFDVAKAPASVSLSADRTAVTEGEPITFTASLSVGNGQPLPTGDVTFVAGSTVLGTAPIIDGRASLVLTTLPTGSTAVAARFAGTDTLTDSTSTPVTTVVSGRVVAPVQPPLLVGFREFSVGAGTTGPGTVRFFNPDGSERFSIDLFPGFTGGVRVTSADFNGDGIAEVVAGTGPGRASRVIVLDGKTKNELFRTDPFEEQFVGGVYVTTGDLDADGVPDLIITPDEGGGPRVDVYSGAGFGKVASFFGIDDPAFRGGARAAVSDMNGDTVGDLVVSAGFGGGPRVAGYTGQSVGAGRPSRIFADFFAFEPDLRNGAFVGGGDIDGDGVADLLAGGGPGGGPRVTVFGGKQLMGNEYNVLSNFFAGDVNNRGGVRLVARNLDDDNRADLVVGDGSGAGSRVTGYVGKNLIGGTTPSESFQFSAFPGFDGGVFVG